MHTIAPNRTVWAHSLLPHSQVQSSLMTWTKYPINITETMHSNCRTNTKLALSIVTNPLSSLRKTRKNSPHHSAHRRYHPVTTRPLGSIPCLRPCFLHLPHHASPPLPIFPLKAKNISPYKSKGEAPPAPPWTATTDAIIGPLNLRNMRGFNSEAEQAPPPRLPTAKRPRNACTTPLGRTSIRYSS